jgi:hypothetical protein
MKITGKDKVFMGVNKESKEKIYITKPTFDCGWYWSFGYLGNKDCHYHLDGYANGRTISMYDALLKDYELSNNIKNNLLDFCELALSIYQLKTTAELFGRGGMSITNNPCKDSIINTKLSDKINQELLPIVMQKFWDLIEAI